MMDRYLFVLGSNWQLSLAELDNYLKNSQNKGRIIDYSATIAIVEFEKLHKDKHYVNKLMELQFILGGCQKIAKVYDFIDIQTIHEAFPLNINKFQDVARKRKKVLTILENTLVGKNLIFPKAYESMFYAISIYPNLYDDDYYTEILVKHFLPFLNTEIMEIIKRRGSTKVLYYKYPEKNIKSGNLNPIFPHIVIKYDLLNENRAELIFGFTEDGVYIARTFTVDDPNFKKQIDEERPFKEFKSSISPKLATIMLNFLNLFSTRRKKKILDPFAGNGTILLFALLQDFLIYGSDNDIERIEHTTRNLNWLLELLEEEIPPLFNKRITRCNIKNLAANYEHNFFDGICTEPELGPYYLEKPYYSQVKELIETKLQPLYDDFLRESYKILKLGCRICFISPIFNTIDGGEVQLDIENLAGKYNFNQITLLDMNRLVKKSNEVLQFGRNQIKTMIDAKKGQIIIRKLYVFEKQ